MKLILFECCSSDALTLFFLIGPFHPKEKIVSLLLIPYLPVPYQFMLLILQKAGPPKP